MKLWALKQEIKHKVATRPSYALWHSYTLPALLTLLFKGWPVGVGYLLIVGAVEWLIVLATWLQVPMWIYGLLLAWTPAAALKLFWSWQRNKRVSA